MVYYFNILEGFFQYQSIFLFITLSEPNATKLERLNLGFVVESIGKFSDPVPYTAFNARKSFIANNKDLIKRFKDALNKGLKYTFETDNNTLATKLSSLFPDTSLNDLEQTIKRYKEADSWITETTISEELFSNLQNMLIEGKLIKEKVPYQDLIIND